MLFPCDCSSAEGSRLLPHFASHCLRQDLFAVLPRCFPLKCFHLSYFPRFSPMLWIALHCPALSLDWIERRFPVALIPAMAVTVRKGNQSYIRQANKPAQEAGITTDQPLASAMAFFPGLVVVEQDLN